MSAAGTTIADLLADARMQGVDRLDAQMLLARAIGRPRTWLVAHDDAPVPAAALARLRSDLARRAAGEPLAYIVGEKEFHGLSLTVNPDVLVPRPDTEVIVDWALELLRGALSSSSSASPRVVDLGTGSGAIALAVKHAHPVADVVATDLSPAALRVAGSNASRLNVQVEFEAGSWWQAVAGRKFHLVLSNPPYIADGDPHLAALGHEPLQALTPGGDGLGALRQIAEHAAEHLFSEGWLLLEHGFDQADAVQRLLVSQGFVGVQTRHDLGGQPRCTGGHR